jgi:signal transduction histidine kinase
MGIFSKNLRTKIFLITSVTIFILVSALFIFEYTSDKKILYERQVIHMKENSFTIRNSLESVRIPMLFQSILEEYADNILKHQDSQDSVKHDPYEISSHDLHVVNTDSIVMASTKPELIGLPLEDSIEHREEGLEDVLQGRKNYSVDQMKHSGVEVLDVSVPIRDDGRIIGALHYVEPYMKLEKLIRDSLVRHLVFALILIISLSLIINLFLTKMVSDPIKDLSSAMDGLRLKGQSNEVTISSKDEIGSLIQSFNEMSHTLREREAELKKHTTSLEEMVKVRTDKLEESHSQLLHSRKLASLGIIASGVAHEINNPLGGMFNCVEMLEQRGGEEEFRKRYLDLLKDGLGRIENTVGKLLWMSRKRERTPQLVEIKGSLNYAYAFFDFMIGKKNIVYKENIEDSLSIFIDPQDLQQILINLIINAIQSMEKGGTLSIHAYKDNSKVILDVSDSGEGIEEKNLDNIFNPFYTTKPPGEGTGLGLWLIHEIIENYNGKISVQSKKGEGTKFSLIFNSE